MDKEVLGTWLKWWVIPTVLVMSLVVGCSGDSRNEFARTKIAYLDGNYKVTHYNCGENITWMIKDDKVTSTTKGYYYFWSDGKYVQVPVNQTVIEEIK